MARITELETRTKDWNRSGSLSDQRDLKQGTSLNSPQSWHSNISILKFTSIAPKINTLKCLKCFPRSSLDLRILELSLWVLHLCVSASNFGGFFCGRFPPLDSLLHWTLFWLLDANSLCYFETLSYFCYHFQTSADWTLPDWATFSPQHCTLKA